MPLPSRTTRLLVFLSVLVSGAFTVQAAPTEVTPTAASAVNQATLPAKDPLKTPALAAILKGGAEAHYLGNFSGLDGWVILKDHQIQIVYTTTNPKLVILGVLFTDQGENITVEQLHNVLTNNKELATQLASSTQQQAPSVNPPLANAQAAAPAVATPVESQAAAPMAVPMPPQAFAAQGVSALMPPVAIPSKPLSPGEKLLRDFEAAHGVVLGTNKNAPELYMVMDPNCPHCKATWSALRDAVFTTKIRLHFIPIGTEGGEDERAAAILLTAVDPLTSWDKYVTGDKTPLAGTPDPALLAAIRSNYALVDSWGIHITPYLAYRAKDGKVKVLQGEPEKVSAVLNDML